MGQFLFSTDRDEFIALSEAAERGDTGALQALRAMWGTGDPDDVLCFLCSAVVGRPIVGMIFPTLHDPETLVGVAICSRCSILDNDTKFDKAMHRLREGEGDVTVH